MRIKFVLIIIVTLALNIPTASAATTSSARSSLNWAGYASTGSDFTAVNGSWIVPDVRNNKNLKTDAAWVGIGGVNSADLIQAGTSATTGTGGPVAYQAWYELLPDYSRPIPLAVKNGDSISVSIMQTVKNKWKISFVNNSTGKKFVKFFSYKSSLSSVEWIEEMPSNGNYDLMPLDNFKTIHFSGASAVRSGKKVSISEIGAKEIVMASSNGKSLAAPSLLSNSDSGFDVRRMGALAIKLNRMKLLNR